MDSFSWPGNSSARSRRSLWTKALSVGEQSLVLSRGLWTKALSVGKTLFLPRGLWTKALSVGTENVWFCLVAYGQRLFL